MITCAKVENTGPLIEWLRRDIWANQCILESLIRNMPPVPREVWVAEDPEGAIVGMMMLEEFPHGPSVDVRVDRTEAIAPLLRSLKPDRNYGFYVPVRLREALRAELVEPSPGGEGVSLTISREDLLHIDPPGEIRRLNLGDKDLTDRFPDPGRGPAEPHLSRFVEWAEKKPEESVVFGLIVEGEIVSFVQVGLVIEDLWEVGMIRTREEHRRKGYAKALLSYASKELLERGIRVLYKPWHEDSLRTAQAVGYREVFRGCSCTGRVQG